MGYQISAVACLRGDSAHSIFLIFMPSHRLEYEWINSWIYSRFGELARRLGPQAVIVAPHTNSGYSDLRTEDLRPDGLRVPSLAHSGFPFLVVASGQPGFSDSAKESAAMVNLASFSTGQSMAALFDVLTEATHQPQMSAERIRKLIPASDLSKEYDKYGGWSAAFNEAVQIKPNFFGMGVDVNALVSWWRKRRHGRSTPSVF